MKTLNASVESPYNVMAGAKMKEYQTIYHISLERLEGRTIQIMMDHIKGILYNQVIM